MDLLPKVRVGDAGATTGSRVKVMRSFPGSAAMVGFTGAVKLKTRREGLSASDAVKWGATLPIERRSESSRRGAGPPRKRGRVGLSDGDGTQPRLFSARDFGP